MLGERALALAESTDPARLEIQALAAESHLRACPKFNKFTKFIRPNEFHTSDYLPFETLLKKEFSTTQKWHSQNQARCICPPQSRAHTNQRVTAENPLCIAVIQLLIFPGEFGTLQPAQVPTFTSQEAKPELRTA